jgi:peptide/nickel transport system ATP-binding protein
MTSLLEVSDLATHFFTRAGVMKAVDGVSFSLGKGEVLGLVGESGSGKSVSGFSLMGLVDPPGRIVRGSVRFQGRELVGMRARELRNIRGKSMAMVFQDPTMALNPVLTIQEQMRLALLAHARMPDAQIRDRCVEVLGLVGIPEARSRLDAYPHEFSGGMRQRVAIAIALLHNPSLIIADEPTTALDVSVQAQILTEMRDLVRRIGTALIWISHDLATVSALADRIAVMYAGRIVEEGPTLDVLHRPRHPYTRGLLDSLPSRTPPGQELPYIRGMMPSLLALTEGCSYAPRCERADASCRQAPELRRAGAGSIRCHHPSPAEAA